MDNGIVRARGEAISHEIKAEDGLRHHGAVRVALSLRHPLPDVDLVLAPPVCSPAPGAAASACRGSKSWRGEPQV